MLDQVQKRGTDMGVVVDVVHSSCVLWSMLCAWLLCVVVNVVYMVNVAYMVTVMKAPCMEICTLGQLKQ